MRGRQPRYERRWFRVGKWRVHARVDEYQAPPGRPPVVLVHGMVVSSRYMVPTLLQLAPHVPVWAPDLPGHGHSDRPPRPLDVPGLAEALLGFLDAAELHEPVLIGNSAGCQVVAELGARWPDRVSRAVFLGPTFDPTVGLPVHVWRWVRDGPHEPPSLMCVLIRDYADFGPLRWPPYLRSLARDRIDHKLPRLSFPVLVVRGGYDPIVPRRWAEEVRHLLPDARLVELPRVSHTSNYSAPARVAEEVLAFLEIPSIRSA